jgi:hypothetical protein
MIPLTYTQNYIYDLSNSIGSTTLVTITVLTVISFLTLMVCLEANASKTKITTSGITTLTCIIIILASVSGSKYEKKVNQYKNLTKILESKNYKIQIPESINSIENIKVTIKAEPSIKKTEYILNQKIDIIPEPLEVTLNYEQIMLIAPYLGQEFAQKFSTLNNYGLN